MPYEVLIQRLWLPEVLRQTALNTKFPCGPLVVPSSRLLFRDIIMTIACQWNPVARLEPVHRDVECCCSFCLKITGEGSNGRAFIAWGTCLSDGYGLEQHN